MRTPALPTGARRNALAVVAALTVAAVAIGVAAVSMSPASPDRSGDGDPAAASASPSQPSDGASALEVDHGPSADPAAVADCAGDGFADDPADVEVLYDVVQEAPDGPAPVLALRNTDGELRLCDMTGPDAPAVLPLPQSDAATPVVELTAGDRVWDCDETVLAGFRATTWLSTEPDVAEVAQRFVVDGTPGPWFSSTPVGGIAHVQVWLGLQVEDAEIHLEQRALHADGSPVETTWAGSQRIAGCHGTDGEVQIG
jgi:hypothetical protein